MANIRPSEVALERLNQQQAAYLLGVTSRSLRDWSDVPRNEDGTYNGRDLVQWFAGRQSQSNSEYDNQRERLAAAQAEKVETENRVRRQELAEMSEVADAWSDHIANARSKLLSMPAKLGPQLVNLADPAVIASKVRTEIYASLLELAADVRPSRKARRDTESVAAPAKSDGIGVG
jgi:phage terminase Nu1 subunit (DNA packaging protein)